MTTRTVQKHRPKPGALFLYLELVTASPPHRPDREVSATGKVSFPNRSKALQAHLIKMAAQKREMRRLRNGGKVSKNTAKLLEPA